MNPIERLLSIFENKLKSPRFLDPEGPAGPKVTVEGVDVELVYFVLNEHLKKGVVNPIKAPANEIVRLKGLFDRLATQYDFYSAGVHLHNTPEYQELKVLTTGLVQWTHQVGSVSPALSLPKEIPVVDDNIAQTFSYRVGYNACLEHVKDLNPRAVFESKEVPGQYTRVSENVTDQ